MEHTHSATICIEGLSVYAHHGVVAEERDLGRRFKFNIELDVSNYRACESDDISDALAYEAVAAVVVEVASSFSFNLLESLAQAVCVELLTEFPADRVRLAVTKFAPNISYDMSSVTVKMERSRVS